MIQKWNQNDQPFAELLSVSIKAMFGHQRFGYPIILNRPSVSITCKTTLDKPELNIGIAAMSKSNGVHALKSLTSDLRECIA